MSTDNSIDNDVEMNDNINYDKSWLHGFTLELNQMIQQIQKQMAQSLEPFLLVKTWTIAYILPY